MKKLVILLLLFSPALLYAQKLPDFGYDKVRISNQDQIIQAEILPVSSEPVKKASLFYYWYASNQIHETQGSYSGHLLNGTYNEYFPDKSLKAQGQFKKGLKDGVWRNWNSRGTLIDLYTWKNGLKDGDYMLFDEQGNAKESGKYRHDMIVEPDSSSFWKKVKHIIKKKN